MDKNKGFLSILIPGATVFFSSACIMVLELVASRLIAKHLGSSLYTWTSVIGIVLAGITIGNYLGGRIADRFPARKALAIILGISSATCVVTVILNNLVGEWIWLWKLSWPAHVLTHVFLVFMLPSTLLGTISPVVAKMALDKGLPTGRTVGDIYAFGAAGSIVGTFLAGFYLIAMMGTVAIIWSIGAALLLMAILYWYRLWVLYLWAAVFIALMTMGMAPLKWAEGSASSFALSTAWSLALREKPDPAIIYEDESQYCHIVVKSVSDMVDKRTFTEDKLIHSIIIMDNILNLQYPYEQIYAAVTHLASRDKSKLSVFAIGGGGYVFPRYVEKVWPGSQIDVAEIDPRVTEAAIQGFGLNRNTSINTVTMDARNYVDELLNKQRNGKGIPRYDFIYEDAISDYSVPYQLTTREFNDKIARLLTNDGVYMINLIDTYYIGLFAGAVINTLEQTFSNIYIITEEKTHQAPWGTFVIVAAMREINLENLASEKPVAKLNLWILNNSEIETLKRKGRGVALTDDYAPVENMLAPVVRQSAIGSLPNRYMERAIKLENQGKLDESLEMYKEAIKLDPAKSITAYNSIGQILASQGKWQQSIDAAKSAIEYNEKAGGKHSMADMYFNIALASEKLSRNEDASEYLHKAIEAYQKDLAQEPNIVKTLRNLGNALVKAGRSSEATEYLQQAVDREPFKVENHLSLADALSEQQRYDEAITVLKKAIDFFSNIRTEKAIMTMGVLQKHLWSIEDKKNSNKK
jgi:tetratricopeptide (TPR) repeat protein